ncbi:spirocyclase AveC family protein [Nocardia sp. NPDC051570]|uniref:spirocyclase AveC family protein n=1 Tax=Nocardia sp. NPDC051570 TaxID=3364324 RepID=UPI00379468B0
MTTDIAVAKSSGAQRFPWRRYLSPVYLWAAFGVVALVAQVVVLGRWIAAGNIHATPRDYDISTARMVITWTEQGLMAVGVVGLSIYMVFQSRRAGGVTFWATIVWGNLFTWWLSPVMAYVAPSPIANRYALNVVSWGPYIPGWHTPRPQLHIETFFAAQMFMFPLIVLWVAVQLVCLNYVTRRFPRWSTLRMLPVFFATGMISDFVVEAFFVPITGAYAYPRAIHELSLFGGHWYQLPLINMVLGACLLSSPETFMVWIAQRRNRVVHIFRGSEQMATRVQATMRVLAGLGLANAVMLIYTSLVGAVPLLGTGAVPTDTPGWIWPR